jgi:hypothetical protein
MTRTAFLYGLWCLGIIGLSLTATAYGYSPFADGGGMTHRTSFYGPTHK